MKTLLLLLAAVALSPPAIASYDNCESQRTIGSVTYSVDASPCVAVEHQRGGVCFEVLWGVDLGVVVVGGRDTCQTLVKVDADGCRDWCAIIAP